MRSARSVVVGMTCLVVSVAAGRADALTTITVDECVAGQVRAVAKVAGAYAKCHAKGAAKGVATDTQCLGKATLSFSSGLGKLESKRTCPVEGAAVELADDAFDYAAALDATVGHAAKRCDAAKIRLAAKYVGAIAACHAKAALGTGGVDVDCVSKAATKLGSGIAKAETGTDCSHLGQGLVLRTAASDFIDAATCRVAPASLECGGPTPTPTATPPTPTPTVTATPVCNDGINSPGEPCDPTAPASGWGACRPDQACTDCTCACPSSLVLSADAADPASVLDLGWTGIVHREPLPSADTVTVQLDCPAASHPCGACAVSGPIPNPQAAAGEIDNRRCSTDTSKPCSDDATCALRSCLGGANHGAACAADSECPSGTCPVAGTCVYLTGAPHSVSAGGIAMCLVRRIGALGGTADVEAGSVAIATTVVTSVYAPGLAPLDAPCPRCSDAGAMNDGIASGTCEAGARVGLPCDANAEVPGRPDFGRTSLDCPPSPSAFTNDFVMALGNASDVVTRTLTPASPNCSGAGASTSKCLCDTCNNAGAEPCLTNADCPTSGGNPGVCGGRRCLAGANVGAPCTTNSQCPGSSCARPGAPTQPSSCADTCEPMFSYKCSDPDDDGEGECVVGPTDQYCSLASGHGQRGCSTDGECGGAFGSCESVPRKCFLTGGGSFQPFTAWHGPDTLVAVGMADAPVAGVSHPTLASVLCVGPSTAAYINAVAGLPGPARFVVKSTATQQP